MYITKTTANYLGNFLHSYLTTKEILITTQQAQFKVSVIFCLIQINLVLFYVRIKYI